ncbi:hypothetical protein SUNI508_10178 [Seiridium unicorne]|uniref:CorA-like transporter domain-containing protein n=1 Tax=Seiridium unicorne TaxID=138068 RepID=A0ABR2UM35_9PEZI
MASTAVPAAFLESYSSFERYPLKLVLQDTYGLATLQLICNRINEKAPYIFVEDNDTSIYVQDVGDDGKAKSQYLISDDEIKGWLGDTSVAGIVNARLATKADPRCRSVFLLANPARLPYEISLKSALRILSYHQVSPDFFDFLDVYIARTESDRELRFGAFKSEVYLALPEPDTMLTDLGRSGNHYQLSFNLKTATFKDDVWKIQQAAIHHQFDVRTGVQLWIYGDPHDSLRDRIVDLISNDGNHKQKFETVSASFESSLKMHLRSAKWATEGWRQYIADSEEAVASVTLLFNHMRESRHRRLVTKDLLMAQGAEDSMNETILLLELNSENMDALYNFYLSTVEDDDFPNRDRRDCFKAIKNFERRLRELQFDIQSQILRAKLNRDIMASRKATASLRSTS